MEKTCHNPYMAGAAWSARLAERAAREAGSLAAAASVVGGVEREAASTRRPAEPKVTVAVREGGQSGARPRDELAEAIERSARFLVTYDGRIVATFAREEDAFLLESELADLDRAHGVQASKYEVLERRSGRRLGGYLLAGGRLVVFVRDDAYERKFGRGRGARRTS